jgi:hypothetical protein
VRQRPKPSDGCVFEPEQHINITCEQCGWKQQSLFLDHARVLAARHARTHVSGTGRITSPDTREKED